jgi:hypothetical protein
MQALKSNASICASFADGTTLPPHLAEIAATLPADLQELLAALPPRLVAVAAAGPVYVERRTGADSVTQHVTPVSHRTLESWPLPWWRVNGKATTLLIVLLAVAYSKLASAPMVMSGRRRVTRNTDPATEQAAA